MTTTVAGFILLVLGILIVVVGIIYQPPDRRRNVAVANASIWDKFVDAIIRWIDGLIKGTNQKRQLITLGVLAMLAGAVIIIWPAIGGPDGEGAPDPAPSATPSPTG